ncbi:substrate-binding periplasmic protein [Pelagibaculum spongiae]|uniref:Solute-binding protein family 3/N-terminal domain-containing protein n=1 Tax=Pelagibaculum spongiae TaxID=2080658 RepID=A0A2V1H097_9GAMM|nr:transporter substrate-binding domain-containing protein [Pelagibaculum spongiae]PVZ69483.1 hypothetical protein DC094_09130 [Pelagibaculum spongiae]
MHRYFAFLFVILSSLFSSAQALEVCYEDRPNPPDYYGSGAKVPEHPGANIELMQQLGQQLNLNIKFRRLPWRRCMLLLKQGRVDVIPGMGYLESRENFAVYPMQGSGIDASYRLGNGAFYFYRRKNSQVEWNGRKLKKLKGKVGFVSGYSVEKALNNDDLAAEGARHQQQNLEKLLRGHIGLMVGYNSMVDVVMRQKPELMDQIEKVYPAYQTYNYYLVFSHQYASAKPLMHKKIWAALEKIRESTRHQSILHQYQTGVLP